MRRSAVLATASVLLLSGCGGAQGVGTPSTDPSGEPSGTLTVFAAASLTDVFTVLGEQLEDRHPGLDVQFNFAGSSALATQLAGGAPADVFASADESHMADVEDEGLVEDPELFASNRLMLVVPREDPAGVTPPEAAGIPQLAELVPGDLTMAVCAPEVPCGVAAAEVLGAAGLEDVPDTYEDDVRAVLTKVQLGEVDAGLVYVSDAHAAGDRVVAYAFTEAERAVNRYPVAPLTDAPNPTAARAFVDLVLSPEGQRALRDAGFAQP
jgi:molybdate transport system substrate-binding protein